jgi:hypothetical protein
MGVLENRVLAKGRSRVNPESFRPLAPTVALLERRALASTGTLSVMTSKKFLLSATGVHTLGFHIRLQMPVSREPGESLIQPIPEQHFGFGAPD